MDTFTAWMNALNGIVWGPAMLVLILGTGLYLQLRLFGMPIRRIGAGLRLVWRGRRRQENPEHVSMIRSSPRRRGPKLHGNLGTLNGFPPSRERAVAQKPEAIASGALFSLRTRRLFSALT